MKYDHGPECDLHGCPEDGHNPSCPEYQPESLFKHVNNRLIEIWRDNPNWRISRFDARERFLVVVCFALYPWTLFIAWVCRKEDDAW